MISVNSSDIAAIGYENGTLIIQFHKGGTYTYSNVPFMEYTALMAASSKGKHFYAHIKNVYPATKVF